MKYFWWGCRRNWSLLGVKRPIPENTLKNNPRASFIWQCIYLWRLCSVTIKGVLPLIASSLACSFTTEKSVHLVREVWGIFPPSTTSTPLVEIQKTSIRAMKLHRQLIVFCGWPLMGKYGAAGSQSEFSLCARYTKYTKHAPSHGEKWIRTVNDSTQFLLCLETRIPRFRVADWSGFSAAVVLRPISLLACSSAGKLSGNVQ